MAKQKVPISERALIQRINRKLLDNDQVLKSARGSRAEQELGGFYASMLAPYNFKCCARDTKFVASATQNLRE